MATWQLAASLDKDYIFELAISKGWLVKPPTVQVKRIQMNDTWWVIEPYEENCACPNLVYPPTERIE